MSSTEALITDLRPWIVVLISVAAFFLSLHAHRRQVRREELAEIRGAQTTLGERVSGIHDRLHHVEGELNHMPDKATTHRMEVSIQKLSGDIEVLSERMKPIASIAARIQEEMIVGRK